MKLHLYILSFLIGGSLISCTETIDLTLDDPAPVLVVDGFISNEDTTQFVRLSSLENYFADDIPNFDAFKESKVYLIENGIVADTYAYNPDRSRFEILFQGTISSTYQIDITLPTGERYVSSEEVLNEIVPIDTIWSEIVDDPRDEDYISILINTNEPAGLGDYYQWKSFVNDAYQFGSFDLFFSDDRFVDGQEVKDLEIFSMSTEDYENYKKDSPTGEVFVTIQQNTINLRYYDYLVLVFQQLNQIGSPFASPPAEIRGNVYKTGETEILALGYFYTSGISSMTVKIEE